MPIAPNQQSIPASGSSRTASVFGAARPLYEAFAFSFYWALFGVFSFCWSLVAAVLYLVLPRRLGNQLGRHIISGGFHMFVRLLQRSGLVECDLTALDALQDESPLVIAPNHPGRLDVLLMMSRLPRAVCIIKSPLSGNLFLGGAARLAGYIPNDAPMDMIRTAAREVQNGRSLLVFPEGTRSSETTLGHFRGGFALIAKFANAPVQTVFIENVSGYLGKGWPLFRRPAFPLVFRVRLGRRFNVPPDQVKAFVAELETYYRYELAMQSPPPAIQG